ncbi:penicillin-binding protein 2 [Tissierella sp.]|uniref:peptidoglycan D,D-transpeptidase FtsI family protein n=1 Tax=Tissierella sp. TaxID=41274 RepID=UPI00286504FE|nr:penicillin-binding protein 2 [Tissierella sp.]MDR7856009.1 penicillin-binding protein 2 [Tissierella sp.]
MARSKKNVIHTRIKLFKYISSIVFLVLLIRLYDLQVNDKENLKLQGLRQRSTEINLSSKRGIIYDRNLIPMTNIEKTKTLIASKGEILKNEELLDKIVKNTSLSINELNIILNSPEKLAYIPLKKVIDIEDANNIFILDIVDRYSKSNLLSHVIGYVNKAENKGEYGIEKIYDEFLSKSDKASLFIEYDKRRSLILGSAYHVDNTIDSEDPAGVQLTIDSKIQQIVEEILDKNNIKGAVIVSEVSSGEILSLVSRPNFDQDNIADYFNKDDMALYNKAIQVSYPPGSIFKIVVLLAILEENPTYLNHQFYCNGYENINSLTIKCNSTHGHISLKDGFAKSCNSVFIQIGKEIGSKKIIDMAKTLGLGEKINIGLIEEVEGSLPEGEELLGPAIGNISIGQGKIETTPLQISNLLLIIANNGIQKDMTIVQGITTKDGKIIKRYNKNENEMLISNYSAEVVQELLEEVMLTGTARAINLNDIGGAAGKTGSAEGLLRGEETIHGWFAGYYPRKNPKYVITVLVEEANSGSKSAAPVFKNICEEIYRLNY